MMPQVLDQRLQTQIEKLQTALETLQRGTVPDMSLLEKEVSELCQNLLAAPSAESRQAADKMREMIGLLENLAYELKDFQSILTPEDKTK